MSVWFVNMKQALKGNEIKEISAETSGEKILK